MQVYAAAWTTDHSSRVHRAVPVCACARHRGGSSQIYDRSLEPLGLTVTQFGLLGNLDRLDGISIGDLAGRLVMDPTTLTRTCEATWNARGLSYSLPIQPIAAPAASISRRLVARPTAVAKPAWARAQRHVDKALGDIDAPALNRMLDRVLERLAV